MSSNRKLSPANQNRRKSKANKNTKQPLTEQCDALPKNAKGRKRGEAFTGHGYGTRRRLLFEAARTHIERSIGMGFFCEAITICESVIADRLESRLSFLKNENIGFKDLGFLIKELTNIEDNLKIKETIKYIDEWRVERNSAIHEMVKVEDTGPIENWQHLPSDWEKRRLQFSEVAQKGYCLLMQIYHHIADLNPRHRDRVFPYPDGYTSIL